MLRRERARRSPTCACKPNRIYGWRNFVRWMIIIVEIIFVMQDFQCSNVRMWSLRACDTVFRIHSTNIAMHRMWFSDHFFFFVSWKSSIPHFSGWSNRFAEIFFSFHRLHERLTSSDYMYSSAVSHWCSIKISFRNHMTQRGVVWRISLPMTTHANDILTSISSNSPATSDWLNSP